MTKRDIKGPQTQEARTEHTYSVWHRRFSTRRFIGIEAAQRLSMIDLDAALYVEYDDQSREPLALIETARDVGQAWKSASVTKRLAQRAGVAAFVLLYRCGDSPNPADPNCPDISQFRIKRLWPKPEHAWRTISPNDWAKGLLRIRQWAARHLDIAAANDSDYDRPTPHRASAKQAR